MRLKLVACKDCVFWQAHGGLYTTGACCRHAPRPRLGDEYDESNEAGVVWPVTQHDDGCGDGQEKEAGG